MPRRQTIAPTWPACLFAVTADHARVCAIEVYAHEPSAWNCQHCRYRQLDPYAAFDKILAHRLTVENRGAPTIHCDRAIHTILAACPAAPALPAALSPSPAAHRSPHP
jgi:hypothetical protein